MALFRGIQEYIALDANNITLVFDSGNIVNISGNIFLYPPQGHPILYKYQTFVEARINDNITKFKDTLPKNCLQLFNSSFEKVKSKYLSKVSDLKTECPVVLKDVHCLPI